MVKPFNPLKHWKLKIVLLAAIHFAALSLINATAEARTAGLTCRSALLPSAIQSTTLSTPSNVINYQKNLTALNELLATQDKTKSDYIRHLMSATEFFDYQHINETLFYDFQNKNTSSRDFSIVYDIRFDENGKPFKNFLAVKEFLREKKPKASAQLLLHIHKIVMANGVENVPAEYLGAFRRTTMVGNASGPFRVTPEEIRAITENPYLSFEERSYYQEREVRHNSFWNSIKINVFGKDTQLTVTDDTLVSGRISYPNVAKPTPAIIDKINQLDPNFAREIKETNARLITPTPEQESKLVELLTLDRINEFKKERKKLGSIQIGKNEIDYIYLVADLQRDLVAIHPLYNGNGRSTRLLMNHLLNSEGLPSARFVDPMTDIQTSQAQWRQSVLQGVQTSAEFIADLKSRLETGLPLYNSPTPIFPGVKAMASVDRKKQGSVRIEKNIAETAVDQNQFTAFVKAMVDVYPSLKSAINNDRVRTMSRLAELFQIFFQSKTIRYIHNKDGDQLISLKLIDEDFIDTFGVSQRESSKLWNFKMSRWYETNQLVWRGLANGHKEYSTQELLQYFTDPSHHLASNRVVRAARSESEMLNEIKADFRKYNADLITGDLLQMAEDHHRTGPLYSESYGLSTSKREVVGKAFAMGAMVVGKYGEHQSPELQARLKSRINVAMYRANKDVDLGRLKAFDPRFSYTYGRQAEVMAVGGVDPDSVMLIQRINEKGEVTSTLYRNPNQPSEILEIRGRFVPTEENLTADRIVARHNI